MVEILIKNLVYILNHYFVFSYQGSRGARGEQGKTGSPGRDVRTFKCSFNRKGGGVPSSHGAIFTFVCRGLKSRGSRLEFNFSRRVFLPNNCLILVARTLQQMLHVQEKNSFL